MADSSQQLAVTPDRRGMSEPMGRPLEAAVRLALGLQPGQVASEAELVARLLTRGLEAERERDEARDEAEMWRERWASAQPPECTLKTIRHLGAVHFYLDGLLPDEAVHDVGGGVFAVGRAVWERLKPLVSSDEVRSILGELTAVKP